MLILPGRIRRTPPATEPRINWANPITQGLLDLWLFSEGDIRTRNLVTHVLGQLGHQGTINSGQTVPRGYHDYADRTFDGSSNSFRIDHAVSDLGLNHNFSVWVLWRPISNVNTSLHCPMNDDNPTVASLRRWELSGQVDGSVVHPYIHLFTSGGDTTAGAAEGTVQLGDLVSQGGFIDIPAGLFGAVLNGRIVDTTALPSGDVRSNSAGVTFGRLTYTSAAGNGFALHGSIYAAARWNRVLQEAEWAQIGADPWGFFAKAARLYPGFTATQITGTGSIDGQVGELDGDGQVGVAGTGSIDGQPGVLDGDGQVGVTGTGAIDGQVGVIDGTGDHFASVDGTGAIDGQPGVLDGTGTVDATGTGSIDGQPGVLDGDGLVGIAGTGAIDGQVGVIDGSGTATISGVAPTTWLAARSQFLFDDPALIGPRRVLFVPDDTLAIEFEDEFDVLNLLETTFPDYFDILPVDGATLEVEFIDRFDIMKEGPGFFDTFDILPPELTEARGVPDPDDAPEQQAQTRRDARIQMPIGEVDA